MPISCIPGFAITASLYIKNVLLLLLLFSAALKRCPGLQFPEAVQRNKLRKYIATVFQIVDLRDNELEWLSRHLGHDINVHRKYYRLQEHTLELAKISKLLLAVDNGSADKWAGKTLDDIALDGMLIRSFSVLMLLILSSYRIYPLTSLSGGKLLVGFYDNEWQKSSVIKRSKMFNDVI